MKSKTNYKMGSRLSWSPFNLAIKTIILCALIITGAESTVNAQAPTYTRPSWWIGGAVGGNINFFGGSTQKLNTDLTTPIAFHKGMGLGLYVAPLVEYHAPGSLLGFMLQVGYDSRKGKFDQEISPCNCPRDLSTKTTYISIEPSLRLAPFRSNFYFYGGPRLAYNLNKSFTYKQKINPEFPQQIPEVDIKGDMSDMNSMLVSMQIGAGYDIFLSSQKHRTQFVLSPFVSFQPYFGQTPRSIETWTMTTLRAGLTLKFGRGSLIQETEKKMIAEPIKVAVVPTPVKVVVVDVKPSFTVNSPRNIPVNRRVRETFPIRNYVFFNLGSTQIPDRYVLIRKDQVKDFKEDQLEVFSPKNLTGRSDRQMIVYYNILNILGDRMQKNPDATIILVGSSESGIEDGKAMAQSVRTYLVDVWGIDPSRINIEGRIKPVIPSEQPGGTRELDLLREGDRRVTITTNSPALLMEFQSGPDAPLKPVEIVGLQEAPFDSYVSFNAFGGIDAFSSWSLEIKDDKGVIQNFGPYTQETVTIPGKSILGTQPEGNYKVTMTGKTKDGTTISRDTTVHMVLWTPPQREEGMRFSIIYEFNDSKAIEIYDKYLTNVVIPKVPVGAKVIISGYTDVIGDSANNQKLSMARASDVRNIMVKGMKQAGRNDIRFEVFGFGEDQYFSQFGNKYPEDRFYNRSVIIDIIPKE